MADLGRLGAVRGPSSQCYPFHWCCQPSRDPGSAFLLLFEGWLCWGWKHPCQKVVPLFGQIVPSAGLAASGGGLDRHHVCSGQSTSMWLGRRMPTVFGPEVTQWRVTELPSNRTALSKIFTINVWLHIAYSYSKGISQIQCQILVNSTAIHTIIWCPDDRRRKSLPKCFYVVGDGYRVYHSLLLSTSDLFLMSKHSIERIIYSFISP